MKCPKCKSTKDMCSTHALIDREVVPVKLCTSCGCIGEIN